MQTSWSSFWVFFFMIIFCTIVNYERQWLPWREKSKSAINMCDNVGRFWPCQILYLHLEARTKCAHLMFKTFSKIVRKGHLSEFLSQQGFSKCSKIHWTTLPSYKIANISIITSVKPQTTRVIVCGLCQVYFDLSRPESWTIMLPWMGAIVPGPVTRACEVFVICVLRTGGLSVWTELCLPSLTTFVGVTWHKHWWRLT